MLISSLLVLLDNRRAQLLASTWLILDDEARADRTRKRWLALALQIDVDTEPDVSRDLALCETLLAHGICLPDGAIALEAESILRRQVARFLAPNPPRAPRGGPAKADDTSQSGQTESA